MSDRLHLECLKLTDTDISGIKHGSRLLAAYHALNINERERRLSGCLLIDNRPWTVQGLAQLVGQARSSVAVSLADLQSCGLARREHDGWVLTAMGIAIGVMIFRECEAIAEGKFDHFSDLLVRCLGDLEMAGMNRPFHVPAGSIFKT